MLPFCCESDNYEFKRSLHIHAKEAVQGDIEWGEVSILTESRIQVLAKFLLFYHQDALFQRLVLVRKGINVHGINVMNNVHPYLTEVAYQNMFFLIGRL